MATKKLAEVDMSEYTDDTNVICEQEGKIRRIPFLSVMNSKTIENYFALRRNGKVYTTKFYKYGTEDGFSTSSDGEKMNDNTGLVCEPSTDTVRGRDDYASIGVFECIDCNFIIDEKGDRYPTHLVGDPEFQRTGKVDVGVMQMSAYWGIQDFDTYFLVHWSDSPHPELGLVPYKRCIRSDGSIAPYMIHSKYISGDIDGVPYSSAGLAPKRANSYLNMFSYYNKKGKGYTGGGIEDMSFRLIMLMIKYAQKIVRRLWVDALAIPINIKFLCLKQM